MKWKFKIGDELSRVDPKSTGIVKSLEISGDGKTAAYKMSDMSGDITFDVWHEIYCTLKKDSSTGREATPVPDGWERVMPTRGKLITLDGKAVYCNSYELAEQLLNK